MKKMIIKSGKVRKLLFRILVLIIIFVGGLVLFAYSRTWGRTELEVSIHINEQLVLQSVYGESPTFAIWIEDTESGDAQTIFVTNRAGLDDWEGKAEVPEALPAWKKSAQKQSEISDLGKGIDATTGATPKPGYFITRVPVEPGSKKICWIEMNLAGDYNEFYKQFDEISKKTDEYGTGQPAIVYKAEIEIIEGNNAIPDVAGMSILSNGSEVDILPVAGITSAFDVFDEIKIAVVKPKPKLIK